MTQRPIKFRAWDKHVGHMYECSPLHVGDYLCDSDCVMMQFTGLLDKNGTPVYEGDIVQNLRHKSIAQVIWKECQPSKAGIIKGIFGEENDLTGFIENIGKFKFEGINEITKAFYINEFEVIGNIYENPELLTQK